MGAGIAEVAALHGIQTVLVDGSESALTGAEVRLVDSFARAVERGRLPGREADAARRRLSFTVALDDLAGCDVVIEAVSERLELKRELFGRLAEVCPAPALLATNTSSLRVSSVAAGASDPGRIVGMHFFNPVARMRLVEVIPGAESDSVAVAQARGLGEALGKQVIVASDSIGFLVNRCARPFVGEALRLVQERLATVEQVDRICRMAGGFRMGPFELVDLIGLDVNLEIAESFWFQSYGEPRWQPNAIQARMVDAGRLGRKSGAGFYSYADDGSYRPPDPEPPRLGGGGDRLVAIDGDGAVAVALRERARLAGFDVCEWGGERAGDAWLGVDAKLRPADGGPGSERRPALRTCLCAGAALAAWQDRAAAGFHLIGPLDDSVRLVEVTEQPGTETEAAERANAFFAALGLHPEPVGDAPGLVLGRIVAQLVNEAAFAIGEGVGSPTDIDTGTVLGLNYPRGPVVWSQGAGLAHVRAILTALHRDRGEARYRLAPRLLRGDSLAMDHLQEEAPSVNRLAADAQ